MMERVQHGKYIQVAGELKYKLIMDSKSVGLSQDKVRDLMK